MNRIISYSLWGQNPKYIVGAHKNIELAKKFFPDWRVRIYVSKNTTFTNESDNLDLIIREEEDFQDGCFWRFEECDSHNIVIVRDLDDRLSERHKFVVDEWLKSDKNFHIIRDHPNHKYPIMAGLWGVRNGILIGFKEIIKNWKEKNYYTCDQIFLANHLYNDFFIRNSFIHDPYHKTLGMEKDIQLERKDYEFLGDTFDENDIRNNEYLKFLK
jgi:hypothetical protein